jgi:predicted AAA+ superfamily ATPase
MDIIRAMNDSVAPRYVSAALLRRLAVMPAVVVTGARQAGKSTLVRQLGDLGRRYLSLDDLDVLELATSDPDALLAGPSPVTLDEVQRAPGLLLAVKRAIDVGRTPGQYLLTGSANLLVMRDVSESLAGRASYLTLWPMTRSEQRGLGGCGVWEQLVTQPDETWQELIAHRDAGKEDWRGLARRGGFPTPAIHLHDDAERAIWFDGYVSTYLERDLLQLSAITALPDFRRLMRACCHRLGQVVNQTEIGRDVALPQPTVHRYMNLLEMSYLLVRLPAFAVNRTKRLIKSPRMYWGDTGVALHLAAGGEPGVAHLENIVLSDLLVWRSARLEPTEISYWRTETREEVDLVIEAGDQLIPIEVKSTSKPRLSDAAHLRTFQKEYADRTRAGLLLHDGTSIVWLAPNVLAAPWWSVV